MKYRAGQSSLEAKIFTCEVMENIELKMEKKIALDTSLKSEKLLNISTCYLCCCVNTCVLYIFSQAMPWLDYLLLKALDDVKSHYCVCWNVIVHARFPSPSMKDPGLSAYSVSGVRRP